MRRWTCSFFLTFYQKKTYIRKSVQVNFHKKDTPNNMHSNLGSLQVDLLILVSLIVRKVFLILAEISQHSFLPTFFQRYEVIRNKCNIFLLLSI